MPLRPLSILICVLAITTSAFCDPVVPATYSVAAGGASFAPTGSIGGNVSKTGSTTVTVSIGGLGGFSTNPYGAVLGQAIAGPNDLGVYGAVSGSGDTTFGGGGNMQVTATFQDELKISGPATGFLDITEDIVGVAIDLNFGSGSSSTETLLRLSTLQGNSCVALGVAGAGCSILQNGPNDNFLLPYTVSSGGVVTLGGEFFTFNVCDVSPAPGFNSCFGQSSFLDTAQIASIVVEDKNGVAVPGATVTSLSGVTYSIPTSLTPEPPSITLLGLGSVGVLFMLRRRTSFGAV
jgi:hypothetical protein